MNLALENYDHLLERMDFREKCGYTRQAITIYDDQNSIVTKNGTIWIGMEDSPEFVLNEPVQQTSFIISVSIGPTGKKNSEYLYKLCDALRDLSINDPWMFDLEKIVQKYMRNDIIYEPGLDKLFSKLNETNHFMNDLGIKMCCITKEYISGKMVVTPKHQQPTGILHGGVSVAIAEGFGSYGAMFYAQSQKANLVGIEINANHINSVRADEGIVIIAECVPLHSGKNTQVWQTTIRREGDKKIVCISRLTCLVMRGKL